MNRFMDMGIWILIAAAAVILPLYELADYTEVWQHDGDLILPAIVFLFTGMALLSGKRVFYAVLTVLTLILRVDIRRILRVRFAAVYGFCNFPWSPPRTNLSLSFCGLRI